MKKRKSLKKKTDEISLNEEMAKMNLSVHEYITFLISEVNNEKSMII